MKQTFLTYLVLGVFFWTLSSVASADADYIRALKRAQYLLGGSIPTDEDFSTSSGNQTAYRQAVRGFIDSPNFYSAVLRYHERLLGIGLPTDYLDELMRDDIDFRENKLASVRCGQTREGNLKCVWASADENSKISSCPESWEKPASVFWYPGLVAWVCPSVLRSCGPDLSRCFIQYEEDSLARNSELGTTEAFDSRFSVVKSLAKQPAGIATAVVMNGYPYTKILSSGLTAIDGAIAHFYRQRHHFDLDKLNLDNELLRIVDSIPLTDTKFRLVNLDEAYEQGGILSTFGFLRRYEKNRTRANQLYERLLCRKFTSELPRVFPQDPGNLRTAAGCSGCHATLDPLADFFSAWGEGGDLYIGKQGTVQTTFNNQTGSYVADLAQIIATDNAFATCAVENVWKWLMGRTFYMDEAELRKALTNYFVTVNYNFKELVYALATHPAFIEGTRSDGTVGDPITEPPLGTAPGDEAQAPCDDVISYENDLKSGVEDQCVSCHGPSSAGREDLSTESQLQAWGTQSVNMMSSGNMPPGQAGPPLIGPVYELKEKIRCWLEQN